MKWKDDELITPQFVEVRIKELGDTVSVPVLEGL